MWFRIILVLILIFNFLQLNSDPIDTVAPENIALVYIFMSETCPICKSLTPEIKKIETKYKNQGVELIMVFPNTTISKEADIQQFREKYKTSSKGVIDHKQQLTKQLGATITPEVFVIELKTDRIIYSGKVNDEFVGLGKRKRSKINHYLDNVLEDLIDGNTNKVASTKAVGCFIIKENL